MKIFIDAEFKFLLEDSFSAELERLSKEVDMLGTKSTVVIITIDNKHKEPSKHIEIIIKIARKIIRAARGVDYLDDIITSVKFDDLSKRRINE